MDKYILAIDAGTTSSRAILFDKDANPVEISQYEFNQFFPKEGWVEHDPTEIWDTQLKAIKEVIKKSKIDPKNIDKVVKYHKTNFEIWKTSIWNMPRSSSDCISKWY